MEILADRLSETNFHFTKKMEGPRLESSYFRKLQIWAEIKMNCSENEKVHLFNSSCRISVISC